MEFYVHLSEENIKALKGETDGESGGGDTEQWETLFEGEVTTESVGGQTGNFLDYNKIIDNDTIKVIFDGTEYTCEKNVSPIGANVYGELTGSGPVFSEYPFVIMSGENGGTARTILYTESAGTYSLKIEAPASEDSGSGDNDFSTAEVTLINSADGYQFKIISPFYNGDILFGSIDLMPVPNSVVLKLPVPVGYKTILLYSMFDDIDQTVQPVLTGSVSDGDEGFEVTGDCSITLAGTGQIS